MGPPGPALHLTGEHRHVHVEAVSTLACVMVELPISHQSEGKRVETLFRYALTLTKEGEQWKSGSGMASVPFTAGTYARDATDIEHWLSEVRHP